MKIGAYSEEFQQAAVILLQRFWIDREQDVDTYGMIRANYLHLEEFFANHCGYRLGPTIESSFYRLEKVPVHPHYWMGLSSDDAKSTERTLASPNDYVFLCAAMAFITDRREGAQFLLSHMAEGIVNHCPPNFQEKYNWDDKNYRGSFCRALHVLRYYDIIRVEEGDFEKFGEDRTAECLFTSTRKAFHFLRLHPKMISAHDTLDNFLAYHQQMEQSYLPATSLLRQLLVAPVYNGADMPERERAVALNRHKELSEITNRHLGLSIERIGESLILKSDEKIQDFRLLGSTGRSEDNAVLLFGALVRDRLQELPTSSPQGTIEINRDEFRRLCEELAVNYGYGWSQSMREEGMRVDFDRIFLRLLTSWGLCRDCGETVIFEAPLARVCGVYREERHD